MNPAFLLQPRPALAISFVTAMLAGCTPLSQQYPAGTPYDTLTQRLGEPTVTCPTADGGRRSVWSDQPHQQAALATEQRPDGTTTGLEQVLTDAAFYRMRNTADWDMDRVMCTFGPPSERAGVGLPGHVQRVWSYKYKQDGVWNSLMHVYFDAAGAVTRFHPGPDPEYDHERLGPF